MQRNKRTRTITGTAAGLALAAMMLTGCSDDANGTSTTVDEAGLQRAIDRLEAASGVPEFTLDAPAFDMSKVDGKTIFSLPVTSSVPDIVRLSDTTRAIAESYGAKWVEFTNQGAPTDWNAGIDQAISQKVDVIFLSSLPPEAIVPSLQKAKAAGIPVVLGQSTPYDDLSADLKALITNTVNRDFIQGAELEADWVIAETEGKANVVLLTTLEVNSSQPMIDAFTEEFEKNCPDCTMKVTKVLAADWPTKIPSEVVSEIRKNPGLNAVVPMYDAMASYAASGIQQAAATGKVMIGTFNGSPPVLKMLQEADTVMMDAGESYEWAAHAIMDQLGRVLTGAPQIPGGDAQIPLRVFTDDNVDETGTPPVAEKGYGDSFIAGYEALWSGE